MAKKQIENITVHFIESENPQNNPNTLSDNINEVYIQIIERHLRQAGLNTEQKIYVVDKIIKNLKVNGTLK